jgi:hypothetical protein
VVVLKLSHVGDDDPFVEIPPLPYGRRDAGVRAPRRRLAVTAFSVRGD